MGNCLCVDADNNCHRDLNHIDRNTRNTCHTCDSYIVYDPDHSYGYVGHTYANCYSNQSYRKILFIFDLCEIWKTLR
jgi:hypothetical protein